MRKTQLFANYERLARQNLAELTADERTSLLYYLAERGIADYDPYVEASAAERRRRRWANDMRRLESFIQTQGRWPRRNARLPLDAIPVEERHLCDWMRSQRRRSENLCSYQRERLEGLTEWSWSYLEETWDRQVDRYVSFVENEGRRPVTRGSGTDAESRIAQWVKVQQQARRKGTLAKHRIDELERLPMWQWR